MIILSEVSIMESCLITSNLIYLSMTIIVIFLKYHTEAYGLLLITVTWYGHVRYLHLKMAFHMYIVSFSGLESIYFEKWGKNLQH